MEMTDKIIAVGKMQQYIETHFEEDITLEALSQAADYSKYHATRVFKALVGQTPFEVIRALRLTKAAQTLRDSTAKVVTVALDSGFDSHDGFTRAFARRFTMTPRRYRLETPAVPYYIPHPVDAYYRLKEGASTMAKNLPTNTMTVTAVERSARKLILLRASNATDYLTFCQEVGCAWEGLLNSIAEKLDAPALLTLPNNLVKPGTGRTAAGVEVPQTYNKSLPDGVEIITLPPCTMLYFQGPCYQDEQDFAQAIGALWDHMAVYDPQPYGWTYAPELAPYFNFGASAPHGAKMARPAKKR